MIEKLKAVERRYEELCARSEQPDFYADPQRAAKLLREKNDLEPIVDSYRAYNEAVRDMEDARELMSDPEMKELCQETYQEAKERKERLFGELQILLLPKDPNDERNVIMEIRGGVGGEESALAFERLPIGQSLVPIFSFGGVSTIFDIGKSFFVGSNHAAASAHFYAEITKRQSAFHRQIAHRFACVFYKVTGGTASAQLRNQIKR